MAAFFGRAACDGESSIVIPYGRQTIEEDDIESVVGVLRSDWLTQGPKIEEFEQALAQYCGSKYAVVFASGTAALHAAYFAAGIGAGDEFITSPLTFAATSNAGLWLGARPVFADIDPETGNLDPRKAAEKITKRTKAIVPVDYSGHPAELDEFRRIAQDNNLILVEDACHALGASYSGRKIGSLSDITVFSFHPIKAITTGEGGAIITSDKKIHEKLIRFRHHGIARNNLEQNPGDWYYEMHDLGLNYRLTDIQCALGISQLKKLERFVEARKAVAQYYYKALSGWPEIELPVVKDGACHAFHLFVIRLNPVWKHKRDEVFKRLRSLGIGAQVHYMPVYRHPYYKSHGFGIESCPNAEDFYSRAISIPIFPSLTSGQQGKVADALRLALDECCNETVSQ
ncbi:UDP-4-amino-4,6-dideoxy-N-acetyl-beta-L-altrosamine transaminase [Elusimicrobiota bacterium]